MFERYAVYYTPEGALAKAGAAWLGWDVAQGRFVDQPQVAGFEMAHITQAPRKYGLHGTIKPPFFLAPGTAFEDLKTQLAQTCAARAPVTLDGLHVDTLGSFVALTPRSDQTALAELAGQIVTRLDGFRAPPTQAELARRRKTPLTPAQEQHLADWGYPYVMDQFRFHITLSGQIPDPAAVADAAQRYFAPHLPSPFRVSSLTLAGQDGDGMFHEIHRYALAG